MFTEVHKTTINSRNFIYVFQKTESITVIVHIYERNSVDPTHNIPLLSRRQSPCQQAQVMINVLECFSSRSLRPIRSTPHTLSSGRNVLGILAQPHRIHLRPTSITDSKRIKVSKCPFLQPLPSFFLIYFGTSPVDLISEKLYLRKNAESVSIFYIFFGKCQQIFSSNRT